MENLKRGFVFLLTLMSINLVSAQYYRGSSLGDIFRTIDPETMILVAVFGISLALIYYPLSRFFRDNIVIAGVISTLIALSLTYGVIYSGFDIDGFFFDLGFSGGFLYTIIPILMLAVLIYLVYRFSLATTLGLLGLFLIGISFTDLIYEKGITATIGGIIFLIGAWLWQRRRRGSRTRTTTSTTPTTPTRPTTPTTTTTPTTPTRPTAAASVARFDVIVGGKTYANPSGQNISATDLVSNNSAQIQVSNGGSGGILNWKAAASKGLSISKKSGKLKKGKSDTIIVTLTDPNVRYTPHVSIAGKRGGTDPASGKEFIRQTVGRTKVSFRIR
tara:strand:- start:222 stop:1214 length:993 start_codon:yes stop_codon:yes gene_type:complete